jgi:hypothetical protein
LYYKLFIGVALVVVVVKVELGIEVLIVEADDIDVLLTVELIGLLDDV